MGQVMIEQLDVAEDDEIDALKARLSGKQFDLLFLSAGIIHNKAETAESISRDEFARLMQINALGPARIAERLMDNIAPNGTVAAMTSELASITDNNDAVWDCYRASKAALNMLMRSIALRHRDEGRSFLLIAPGWVKTDLGGQDATLGIDESIPRVVDQIEAVFGKKGLRFLNYEGKTLPW
jgi:NAD(P)-dependent dehydrogenase (short-subunit alcohol dehydrogenase family)